MAYIFLVMKIATATLGYVVAISVSANAVAQATEHGAHSNLKGGKSMIKSEASVATIDKPKSITLT